MRDYFITVDNSRALTHNTNIDYPRYYIQAMNKFEAVGKMILSDWEYKDNKIYKILEL